MVPLAFLGFALWLTTPATNPASAAARSAQVSDAPAARAPVQELTLSAALEELDRQNLSLVQVRERAREASGVVSQAASPLLPTVTASSSWVRYRDEFAIRLPPNLGPGVGLPPGGVTVQPLEQLSATGTLRVPLVVPTAWFDLSQARGAARAAEAGAEATRQQVRAGFAQAAYGAVASEEVVLAAERALANAAELTRSSERRVAAGTAAPLDMLKARTEEVARRSDLVRARADVDRARFSLGVLLGREGPVRVTVPDVEPAAPGEAGAPEEQLGREALARRPEVAVQRAQVEAAEAGTRSAWARLAPQLSASGSAFVSDIPYPTGKKDGWRVSLDLTWALWDGGLQLGKRRQAQAQAAGARAAADAERLGILQEVHDATRDLGVAREQLELAEQRRALAAEAAASARRSFEAGIASSLDVIDANDRLFTADQNRAAARAQLAQARVALQLALGRNP
jgi:outer membrane protein TolC